MRLLAADAVASTLASADEPVFEAIPHAARERLERSWAISSLQHHAEKKALAELLHQVRR